MTMGHDKAASGAILWVERAPCQPGIPMTKETPPESEPAPSGDQRAHTRRALSDARRASSSDQAVADADQSASDADQVFSDADQTASDSDQSSAESDQRASDNDQASADKDRAWHHDLSLAEETAYESSRESRVDASMERLGNRRRRDSTALDRDRAATDRDLRAEIRDEGGRGRDAHAGDLAQPSSERERLLLEELQRLRAQAASDRARAAEDRARAAADRANSARERSRLEAELQAAHLDGLTGAYRREIGLLALSHEIDRARRADGRFVVAFVDVDLLKQVNDRDGHAAGDQVLQTVVKAIRARLRSFDPIIRHGGDEFVCGLSGADIEDARRRFTMIEEAVTKDAKVGISVGLAELAVGDTAQTLTDRADAAMLEVKATHQARF
jgi:diguanylate cyclase (GGDEF)-like protein